MIRMVRWSALLPLSPALNGTADGGEGELERSAAGRYYSKGNVNCLKNGGRERKKGMRRILVIWRKGFEMLMLEWGGKFEWNGDETSLPLPTHRFLQI